MHCPQSRPGFNHSGPPGNTGAASLWTLQSSGGGKTLLSHGCLTVVDLLVETDKNVRDRLLTYRAQDDPRARRARREPRGEAGYEAIRERMGQGWTEWVTSLRWPFPLSVGSQLEDETLSSIELRVVFGIPTFKAIRLLMP